ncbi:hypothetical protein ROZALSC1DRAFT_20367 [Rozella allomycis CSF55]|nr:hypothetical protein ROZALSC1DRAFT_20367 [Rozella allomycis CSF55]
MDGLTPSQYIPNEEEGEIRCVCEIMDDDGFTIQCDKCGVWQHTICMGIAKEEVPDTYFCEKCEPRAVDVELAKKMQQERLSLLPNSSSGPEMNESYDLGKRPRGRPPGKKRYNEETDYEGTFEVIQQNIVSETIKKNIEDIFMLPLFATLDLYRETLEFPLRPMSFTVKRIRNKGFPKKGNNKFGIYAGQSIDAGRFIYEFRGIVQLKAMIVSEISLVECNQSFVLFHPQLDFIVDAREVGDNGRFIRRSCRPNAEIRTIVTEDEKNFKFGIFAKTTISENEEIFIDVDFEHGNSCFVYECGCNNPEFCLANFPNQNIKENVQKKRGRKKKSINGESDKDIIDEGESELSDVEMNQNMLEASNSDFKKLSREERKIMQYMESFERLEKMQQRKKQRRREQPENERIFTSIPKAGRRGRPKKEQSVESPASTPLSVQTNLPSPVQDPTTPAAKTPQSSFESLNYRGLKKVWMDSYLKDGGASKNELICTPIKKRPLGLGIDTSTLSFDPLPTSTGITTEFFHNQTPLEDSIKQSDPPESLKHPDSETPSKVKMSLSEYMEQKRLSRNFSSEN